MDFTPTTYKVYARADENNKVTKIFFVPTLSARGPIKILTAALKTASALAAKDADMAMFLATSSGTAVKASIPSLAA